MSSKFHYVYKLIDVNTGQFYIGSRTCECNPEEDNYMGSPYTWKPIMENLSKEIIKDDFETREEAIEYESNLIGENINDQLNENYHIPNKGFHCQGITGSSHWMYGKKHTEETKMKMSNNHVDVSGKNNPMYGKRGRLNPRFGATHTDDAKLEMSLIRKKWWNGLSEEKREKAIKKLKEIKPDNSGKNNPMYGKHHSDETIKKMREKLGMKIIHIETGKEFACAKEASEYFGFDRSGINKHCNGYYKKQKFKFKDIENE